MSVATATDFLGQDWTIEDSTAKFLLLGDRIEFTSVGKQVKVRVIRGSYTVAIGAAKLSKGGLNAVFASRVGIKTEPFVSVRFEIHAQAGKRRLRFSLKPIYDAGKQPDQGGSAGGSGGSTGGGGTGGGSGGGGEDDPP